MAKRKIAVVPTFNERNNIERIVPQILEQDGDLRVLVVDDNSPDGTGEVVRQMGNGDSRVVLLERPERQGLGPAYKDGFKRALEMGADYIVQMDADFSHPPHCLPEFFGHMDSYDIVLGSRYLHGITVVNWPIERLLLSYFGNKYVKLVTGLPVQDTTGGFKCWRREALERIGLSRVRSNGYAFQIEMTYRGWRKGLRIKEVPIIFLDRTLGESKMTKRISLEALWVVWWLRFAYWTGRL